MKSEITVSKIMTDKKLPPDFMMLRNPQPNAYTIDEQEECLKLPAKAVAIGIMGVLRMLR